MSGFIVSSSLTYDIDQYFGVILHLTHFGDSCCFGKVIESMISLESQVIVKEKL